MKFIDLFAGIGGFRSGLEKAGHKCVGYVEWDKFARQSYQAMYDTRGEFTDDDIQRTKGIKLPEADLWTFGSPCTNISIAGNRTGIGGEQSHMFFEVIRLLKERAENQKVLPAYLIMENVKNLLSSNQGRDFAKVIYQMGKVGYDAEWCVFDSAEVVPQHRERIYIVGFNKDKVKNPEDFKFPIPPKPKTRVGDILEDYVDNKYTISDRLWAGHQRRKRENKAKGKGFGYSLVNADTPYTNTISARYYKDGSEILVEQRDKNPRKLTPRECWRLQGFTDEQFDKAKRAGVSNSQLYKQAGNAVTVPVVEAIGKKLAEIKKDMEENNE